MKSLLGAFCAAVVVGSLAFSVPTANAAEVPIQPQSMERGADLERIRFEGRRLIDGETRLRVKGASPSLLGRSGDGYVLAVTPREGGRRLVRVEPGRQRVILESLTGSVVLSDNGKTFALTRLQRRNPHQIRSVRNGSLLSQTGPIVSSPWVLDLSGARLLVSNFEEGTSIWNWRENTVEKLTDGYVTRADLSTDRMAYFTGDPTLDGCTVVAAITNPETELWRSCTETVQAFSPDGERMATVSPPSEGGRPEVAWERTVSGDELAYYTTDSRQLRVIGWETATDLLLEVGSRGQLTTVRCSEGDCERASGLRKISEPPLRQ